MNRARANRGNIQRIVEPFSVGVFRALPEGEPDFWCTAFFLQFSDDTVLLTAGHCLRTIRAHVLNSNGNRMHLAADPVFGSQTLADHDPVNDIASIRLSRGESLAIDPGRIVPTSCLAPYEYRNETWSPYITLGVRVKDQQIQHSKLIWQYATTSIMIGAARASAYTDTKYQRSDMLLLDARPSTFRSVKGSGGTPKFDGMSGSPVWRYNPDEPYSVQHNPPLVGMFIGKPAKSPKLIMAVRIGRILDHLSKAYPELAQQLPNFA